MEAEHQHLAGRRVALLALARRKGFAVPSGFVVLRKTFEDLVRDTELKLLLPSLEKRLIARSLPMEAISVEIGKLIRGVKVPAHIMLDVDGGCKALGLGDRARGKAVTLRACLVDERLSSAPLERAVAVTRPADLEARLKDCWASAFSADNLEAARHFGTGFADAAPAVLVTETVPAEVSGVLFSNAPGESDAALVEAVYGFHEALGEGKFAPSRYFVSRDKPAEVRAEETEQQWEYAQGPQGALVRREVPADRAGRPKLSRLQVEELLRAALELERLVGAPVGIEWAIQGGVVFLLQVAPLAEPSPPPSEADRAERYVASVHAAEGALRAGAQVISREGPAPFRGVQASPAPRFPAPTPGEPPATAAHAPAVAPAGPTRLAPPPGTAVAPPSPARKLLPTIRSSLFVELPPGTHAEEARHIPHAGLVLDLGKWAGAQGDPRALAASIAAAAVAVFPRPVLVELGEVDPSSYEALREATAGGASPPLDLLERLLAPTMGELRTLAAAADRSGATNLHVIAPFVKSAADAKVLRAALAASGLAGEGRPHTLAFSELRNPSTLLYNVDFADEQDGIIVRADRFYNALLREGEGTKPAQDADARVGGDAGAVPSPSFVRALFELTRAFERAGGTVLVLLEAEGDFNTVWFYRELGVDGFIAKLEDAEACARMLLDLERRGPRRASVRGRKT